MFTFSVTFRYQLHINSQLRQKHHRRHFMLLQNNSVRHNFPFAFHALHYIIFVKSLPSTSTIKLLQRAKTFLKKRVISNKNNKSRKKSLAHIINDVRSLRRLPSSAPRFDIIPSSVSSGTNFGRQASRGSPPRGSKAAANHHRARGAVKISRRKRRTPRCSRLLEQLRRTPERARNLAQTRSARSPPVHPSRQPVQRFSKWQFPVRDKAHHGTLLEHQTYLIPKPKHPSPHWSCSFLSQHLIPILLHSAKSVGQLQNRQGPKTPSL